MSDQAISRQLEDDIADTWAASHWYDLGGYQESLKGYRKKILDTCLQWKENPAYIHGTYVIEVESEATGVLYRPYAVFHWSQIRIRIEEL